LGGVLIADADSDRGRRIAAACSELGLATRVVTHGAAALEAALADPPFVLIVQLGLPLIAGEQLGQILLTNPRTGDVALVFLADTVAEGAAQGLKGQVIPPPARATDVSRLAQGLLEPRKPSDASEAEAQDADGVEGELSQLPLADLVQLFHVSQKSGIVELSREDPDGVARTGSVAMRAGDLIHAEIGTARGEKALYRLLEWERGRFVFHPSPLPSMDAQETTLQKPTRALVAEGVRQAQERTRLADDLPPLDALVRLKISRASLPIVIHPLTQEVLLVLEVHTRVGDVVEQCSFPDYQVLRTLQTLLGRGMIEVRRESEASEDTSEGKFFSAPQANRLREWLSSSYAGEGTPRDAKLLVVSPDAETTGQFCKLIDLVPALERASDRTPVVDALETIGRLPVASDVGIEFIHLPVAERFAPLWPVIGHGALGVLVPIAAPVERRAEVVRRVSRELKKLPRTRIFYLLLLAPGERVAPDTLRENISLLDDGPLFLIPQGNDEKASILLREMFGRVLP
jgi:CheY-like chemotaxis protein